jgi:hypothetical protein
MSNYLFGINSLGVPNVANTPPLDNSLPTSSCTNGLPNDTYAGYGVNSWEVLYSIWKANQSTLGAQFTAYQASIFAPGENPVCSGPLNIFSIRHGEKNPEKPNYDLNSNGIYRACQLIGYVNELAANGYPISYIITCNPCGYYTGDPSMRPVQTASIISFMLNIPLCIFGSNTDFNAVIANLFPQIQTPGEVGQFDGLNILMVWEHGSMQELHLNIINAAGSLNRLPPSISSSPFSYGDSFFAANNYCPDGNFECIPGVPNYNPVFDATNVPTIGPNNSKYPYWNDNNYDHVYWLQSSNPNYTFSFSIYQQPCYTCFPNCGLKIGLYQPVIECGSTPVYYNKTPDTLDIEQKCNLPTDWST